MKKVRLAILFILISTVSAWSQSLSRVTSGLDLGTGYEKNTWAPSLTYHQELSMSNFSWLRIGWGVRTWGFYANRTDLLPKNSATSLDTLKFGRVSSNGISFLLGANVRLWRFDIGANTDVVALAFGLKRSGLYTNPSPFTGEGARYYNAYVPSNPATLNALPLIVDNQNGQSELYLRYWITDRIGLKLGYVYGRLTYSSVPKLDNGQHRFSTTYGLPYAALSFPLYN